MAAASSCCYFKQKNGVTGLSKKDCNTRLKQIPSMKIWALHQVEPGEEVLLSPLGFLVRFHLRRFGAAQLW